MHFGAGQPDAVVDDVDVDGGDGSLSGLLGDEEKVVPDLFGWGGGGVSSLKNFTEDNLSQTEFPDNERPTSGLSTVSQMVPAGGFL